MSVRAVIIDFDKTITTADTSDILAGVVGKRAESEALNKAFHEGKTEGLTGLVKRINFLKGVSLDDIEKVVEENDHLRAGAVELFNYFRSRGIISIIASGSTVQFLSLYQQKLAPDYLVGSHPQMKGKVFGTISVKDYSGPDFKVRDSKAILDKLGIEPMDVVAIGDSPADLGIFKFAARSIGVNVPDSVAPHVDFLIVDDLSRAIPILEGLR